MSEHRPRDEAELVELIRAIEEPAPERLHRRVAELAAGSRSPAGARRVPAHVPPRARLGLAGAALAAALAAVAIALSSTGSSGSPSLRDAMALTLRGATLAAPSESASAKTQLVASVEGVAFPYWEERFGWRASGARRDTLHGRVVDTVYYTDHQGQRIGYAIVAGTPAPGAGGGVVRWRKGTPYRLLEVGGVSVVTWLRDGRRCVVSGRGVSTATLLGLASWDEQATTVS